MLGNENFIWLKKSLNHFDDAVSQWIVYKSIQAPDWAKSEYESFWKSVVKIGEERLRKLDMGLKAYYPMDKGCIYGLKKDGNNAKGEFYMVHPKTKKKFKVKAGKHEIIEATRPLDIVKSWSSGLMKQHAGSKWVTVSDPSSPLHGRHILIVPHADGTASIAWAPDHSGLTHKVLQPKEKQEEKTPEELAKREDAVKKKEEKAKARREEMSEEDVEKYETARETAQKEKVEAKQSLHEMIREKAGVETQVTDKEKAAIEKKIEDLSKPEKIVERALEMNKIQKERKEALNKIIEEAKKAMLGEQPEVPDATWAEDKKRIAQAIRDNAEEFLGAWYAIQAHQKEISSYNKILNTGMVTHSGSDIIGVRKITTADLKEMVENEKALRDEIAAHYDLIIETRGGIDAEGNEITSGGSKRKDIQRMMNQGSLEAINGLTGEMAGTSIISERFMEELGAANAAVLATEYLKGKLGDDYEHHVQDLEEYIDRKGNQIALDAVKQGDHYLKQAERVANFGKGEEKLYGNAKQAQMAKMQYTTRAYLSYGQAEGGLHMVAELLYQTKANKPTLGIKSSNRPALNRKMERLGLKHNDVTIKRHGYGNYEMFVKPSAYKKLIKEKVVAQFKSLTGEPTPQSIKNLRENTPDWLPIGINPLIKGSDANTMIKVQPAPEQQAAALLLAKEKKIFMNFEAGTGKSFAYILQKAHLEQTTGKPVKTIITMPSKLMGNFAKEVAKFSQYKVVIVGKQDKKIREKLYNSDPNTIVVTNKEKFHFDRDHIKNAGFNMVIADEAHRITQRAGDKAPSKAEKEAGSQMSRGLAEIAKAADYYVAGTGTPTPNDLSELYFHLNVMNPEKYSNQRAFMEKYKSLHKGAGLKDKLQDILNAELDDQLYTVKKKIEGSEFRFHTHNVKLTENQRGKYQAVQAKYLDKKMTPMERDQKITKILNDTPMANNDKYTKIKSIIDDHLATKDPTEKVILYAKNYSTVGEIEKFLKTHYPQFESTHFTGRVKQEDIEGNKQKYLTDPKVKFAIHTDAGTEGLNIHHTGESDRPYGATTAIGVASGAHSWSTLDQFFSRGHRTGATKNVDGHLVLTDTPHDMATEERLSDKRTISNMLHEGSKIDEMNVLRAERQAARTANKSMSPRILIRSRYAKQ
jgi:hypothetical protein